MWCCVGLYTFNSNNICALTLKHKMQTTDPFMLEKDQGLGSWQILDQVGALLPIPCVTCDKLLNLSEPQASLCVEGDALAFF